MIRGRALPMNRCKRRWRAVASNRAPRPHAGGERGNGSARPPSLAHAGLAGRSEEHTSELQSLMRISYAVFCLKKKNIKKRTLEHTEFLNIFVSLLLHISY